MDLNKVMIGGRFTRDHELRYTPKGRAVLSNTVAVNAKWKNESGQQQESVTFFDVTAWGNTAEIIANHTIKGSPVFIEARMKNETWDDKATGQKRSKCVFVVDFCQFLETAAAQAQRAEARGDRPAEQRPAPQQGGQRGFVDTASGGGASYFGDDEEDSIPF